MKPRVWKEGQWWAAVGTSGLVRFFRSWDAAIHHALNVRSRW